MKIQRIANSREGYPRTQSENHNIFNLRKAVTSGNWLAINNGICTLTDLGLRHDGNGLVWLNSGISVHEADSDIGLTGQDKKSYDYHSEVRTTNRLKNNDYYEFVQYAKQPTKAFKHILVDGEYRYVYEDHIHFLTKKRQRIAGKQLTGYTAKGVEMREIKL
ncbi:hypothetical protein [Candidatus Arsenophonus triatominarum]|uniref:hypothetical protein n=1 Tax=Candidatus Arsenophonus triatominarum TaxID=57911 RepID=UPI0007C463BC|nr:hypothetical protein [Candidatus Arsenophonus triatominarum]